MAVRDDIAGTRLHQTKSLDPATADPQDDTEALWQRMMVFNYVVYEVIDALEQERAAGQQTPLNQSWEQFTHHLRLKKPKLRTCFNKLLKDGFWADQGDS